MGPITISVQDANNITILVTPTPSTSIVLDRGVSGLAATVAVGTTTTLPPNSPATVVNVGTGSAAVLNFGIPTIGTAPIGNFTSLTCTGNTVLGDASADNLTTNFGSWTQNQNITVTRNIGSAIAGGQSALVLETNFSGHSGGTTDVRSVRQTTTLSGTNNVLQVNMRSSQLELTHDPGATVTFAYGDQSFIRLGRLGSITGSVNEARGYEFHFANEGSGNIGTAINFFAQDVDLIDGTGLITNNYGFLSGNLGHATRVVGNAIGFDSANMTAGVMPLAANFRARMTSGTNRWCFYAAGNANNAFSGNTRIGSLVAPTATLDVTGTTKISTGLAVGGATPGAGGVAFPATAVAVADANTLDDYREANWTPVVGFTVSNGDLTTAEAIGRLTKIGRLVTIEFTVEFSETTASGNLTIAGVPIANNAFIRAVNGVLVDNMTGISGAPIALLGVSGTTIQISQTRTGSEGAVTNANTGASSRVRGHITYST